MKTQILLSLLTQVSNELRVLLYREREFLAYCNTSCRKYKVREFKE